MRDERIASGLLLSVWLALIGADRINLLDGVASFTATPYLALTPMVVLSELVRHRREDRPVAIPHRLTMYVALLALLSAVATASVVGSPALEKSAQRLLLLGLHLTGTLAVAVLVADRTDLKHVLARGGALGIILFAVFDVLNLASVFALIPDAVRWGTVNVSFRTFFYGSLLPRLAGPVLDVNRGGYLLTVFGFLLWRGYPPSWRRRTLLWLAAAMLLVTVSRSAISAAGATIFTVIAIDRQMRLRRVHVAATAFAVCMAMVTMVAIPNRLAHAIAPLEPLMERFSPREGSAAQHVDLLERGLSTGTQSMQRIALGIGYGSAYTTLQDLFPNNKYASYHSLFVTVFAECGVVALIATVSLIGVPALASGPYRAMVVGSVLFNIAQNAMAEPHFWLILALAWLSLSDATPQWQALAQTAHRD